jgi:hypothetical protein
MCRYAFKIYKPHMVCFNCRVALKNVPECPHCRQPMVDMGLDFKAPRRTQVREWKRVHLIHQAGCRYHSCGCGGAGSLPSTLRDAKKLLKTSQQIPKGGSHEP